MLATVLMTIGATLAGAMGWSFSEYALHNWRGHKGKGKNEFSREHLRHHAREGYFAPAHKKLWAAFKVTLVMLPASSLLLGLVPGIGFTGGFLAAYAGYEWFHRRLHTHPPTNAVSRYLCKHHFYHHFCQPTLNHGVTSPLWDLVFGTYHRPGVIRVPERLAMVWLIDPATGDVAEPFRADYVLARAGERRSDGAGLSPAEMAAAAVG